MRISGPRRNKVIRGCRKFIYEEIYNLHSSLHTCIIRMIKSRRIRWAGQVAFIGDAFTQGLGRKF
jgi:hypothetical protein